MTFYSKRLAPEHLQIITVDVVSVYKVNMPLQQEEAEMRRRMGRKMCSGESLSDVGRACVRRERWRMWGGVGGCRERRLLRSTLQYTLVLPQIERTMRD